MNSITQQPFADLLDIPQWMKDESQKFIDKNTNECGSGWNAWLVPDEFWSLINSDLKIGGVCNIHDCDYWLIIDLLKKKAISHKHAEVMRKTADDRLKKNFYTVIEAQYKIDLEKGSWCLFFWKSKKWKAKTARYQRKGWAKTYYRTVRTYGSSAINIKEEK